MDWSEKAKELSANYHRLKQETAAARVALMEAVIAEFPLKVGQRGYIAKGFKQILVEIVSISLKDSWQKDNTTTVNIRAFPVTKSGKVSDRGEVRIFSLDNFKPEATS